MGESIGGLDPHTADRFADEVKQLWHGTRRHGEAIPHSRHIWHDRTVRLCETEGREPRSQFAQKPQPLLNGSATRSPT
jgi:hypothetical protein